MFPASWQCQVIKFGSLKSRDGSYSKIKCQNKLLRVLNGTRITDKTSTKLMLTKMNMISVNQINSQIKLTEMWKSPHVNNYPVKTEQLSRSGEVANTRSVSLGQLKEVLQTNSSQKTFLNDAIHIWNKTPIAIKQCETLYCAKICVFITNL